MKVLWQPADNTGRCGLAAAVEHYDAVPPIARLLLDGSPRVLTGERMGAAAALIFGRYSTGSFVLPHPVGPALAQAVEDYCAGSWTAVGPIDFEPVALPVGTSTLIIGGAADWIPQNRWGEPRNIKLDVRRSDFWAGQIASVDEVMVASNAWLHAASDDPTHIDHFLGVIAVAVLLSESLQVDCISLPSNVALNSKEGAKVRTLLAASRLGLVNTLDSRT